METSHSQCSITKSFNKNTSFYEGETLTIQMTFMLCLVTPHRLYLYLLWKQECKRDILGYHGNLVTMTTNCDPLSHRSHGMCQFDVSLVFVSHILLKI